MLVPVLAVLAVLGTACGAGSGDDDSGAAVPQEAPVREVPVREVPPDECRPGDDDIACTEAGGLDTDPGVRRDLIIEVLVDTGLAEADAACVADLMLDEFTSDEVEALATGAGNSEVTEAEARLGALLDTCQIGTASP